MNACWEILSGPGGRTLVVSLVHTLWQATALAVLAFALLRAVPARRSTLRYGICLAALGAVLVCGMGTWAILNLDAPPGSPSPPPSPNQRVAVVSETGIDTISGESPVSRAPIATMNGPADTTPWAAVLAIFWLGGVGVMTVRMGLLVAGTRRVARAARPLDDARLLEILDQWRIRLGIGRRMRVLVSEGLTSPAVLGLVRPTLVLPVALLTGIPPEHLDAILLHELAHIRRHDYLVNLLQLAIEAVLFFNPAVWWLSRQVRIEREACCDAVAVRVSGQPDRYAEALADYLARLRLSPAEPAAALAFSRPNYPVLDRVRRVLTPGHRPQLRVSWGTFGLVLLVGGVVLAGLWRGTELAVVAAAEILTPEQRMEALEQVQQDFAPPAEEKQKPCTISGDIRTADGAGLTKPAMIYTSIQSPHITSCGSVTSSTGPFRFEVEPGEVLMAVDAPGYAVTSVGPLRAESGGHIENVDVVLQRGFTGRLKLVDPDGRPLGGVIVNGSVAVGGCGANREWTTDGDGVAMIDNAGKLPYTLRVRAAGFRVEEKTDVRLEPDKPIVWKLRKSDPTTGIVLGPDGAPVTGAALRLLAESCEGRTISQNDPGVLLTTTDAQGRFSLDCLRDDMVSVVAVQAAHFGCRLVDGIKPGQKDREIRLQKPLIVSGTITGDLSLLEKKSGQPIVHYHNRFRSSRSGHLKSGDVPVRIEDGTGHFEIGGLYEGTIDISAGNATICRELTEPIEALVIPLSSEGVPAGRRRVVLQVDVPSGQPVPQGTMYVVYGKNSLEIYEGEKVRLEDGKAEVLCVAGSSVDYYSKGFLGYWFPDGHIDKVAPGEEPLVIHIPAVPAGAVAGTVLDANGKPVKDEVNLTFRTIEASPLVPKRPMSQYMSTKANPADGTFMIAPVPLGGTYVLQAQTLPGERIVVSGPLRLDEAQPLRRLDFRLPEGVTRCVRVLGPDGEPMPNVPVTLGFKYGFQMPNRYHSFSATDGPLTTNSDGRVFFEHLNPEACEYTVEYHPRLNYQPIETKVDFDNNETVLRLQRGLVAEGTLLGPTGKPLPGVPIYAHPQEPVEGDVFNIQAEGPTDAQGRFRFSNLAERAYRLVIPGQNLQPDASDPVVVGGSGESVVIRTVAVAPEVP